MITSEEQEKERTFFELERKRVPELFERAPMIDDGKFLRSIGIDEVSEKKPVGYLRLMPQDFIVEEVGPRGALHTIDAGPLGEEEKGGEPTIYADLVKIGISTLEAKDQLAALLGVEGKNIGYAGIKDRLAITSQRVSVRNLPDFERLRQLNEENFFLKNVFFGKGVVANGELTGNRFIITLRSPEIISPKAEKEIREKLEIIKEDGFWNFFSFQRFGTPRLLSHRLGRLLVRGQYGAAVKMFFTETAARELPYFAALRNEIADLWGDWQKIEERILKFPYHFQLEIALVRHLTGNPADFLGALSAIPDQIRLWFYAYDCHLFNRKLSELIREGEVPFALPLATSFNARDWEPYKKFLEEDEVQLPSRSYRDFPFVRVSSRTWPTLQKVDIHGIGFRERLGIFAFSLPKGSYATTLLNNFFTLASGLPLLPGISTEKIDAKEFLEVGTLRPTLERFRAVLERREEDISREE